MLEYNEDKLESTSEPSLTAKIHLARKQEEVRGTETIQKATTTCLLHSTGVHKTEDCRLFLQKTVKDRSALVKEKKACFNCLPADRAYCQKLPEESSVSKERVW